MMSTTSTTWTASDGQLGAAIRVLDDHTIHVTTEEIEVAFTREQSREIALAVLGEPPPLNLKLEGADIPPEVVAKIVEQLKTGRTWWIQ
jgi:hypothetical protein